MCNKEINKVKRGERLLPSLIELEIGSSVEVPFRLYSENSIRSVASRLKATQGVEFEVNVRSARCAVLTRLK